MSANRTSEMLKLLKHGTVIGLVLDLRRVGEAYAIPASANVRDTKTVPYRMQGNWGSSIILPKLVGSTGLQSIRIYRSLYRR